MLTKLRIQNFKAWRDTGDIRLAPLTVLFGTNSGGKTSIPQLLLLLKQTAESPDRQRALHLGDSRTLADVGTFDDIVHNHDLSRPVAFSLAWQVDRSVTVHDPLKNQEYTGDRFEFAATLKADTKHQPRATEFRYELRHGKEIAIDVALSERALGKTARKKPEFELSSQRYNLTRHPGRAWGLPEPLRFYGFPDEVAAYYQNAAFASDFVLELERMLKSVFYVGPLREYPKRLYLWSGEVPDHVGAKGERAVEAILAAQSRSFNWKPKQRTKKLQLVVAKRLKAMGLIHDFQVKPLGQHRKEYEVLVRTGPKLPEVKLTDVGFGVSQVLPVIVECLYVPRRSIVIFEQPEIHLHPRVQAELADLFVDAISARENSAPRECQFIVESHSEHFLRRLQRRIAENELLYDDAAFYFVHTQGAEAHIEQLDVDTFGNIRNWPEDFFGDEMADLVARSEAQAKRTREEKGTR
jgi:predicted ATPase